jgi:hypothetical protein
MSVHRGGVTGSFRLDDDHLTELDLSQQELDKK